MTIQYMNKDNQTSFIFSLAVGVLLFSFKNLLTTNVKDPKTEPISIPEFRSISKIDIATLKA